MADRRSHTRDPIAAFIARWDGTEQAERANYARFLDELCAALDLPAPQPASGAGGDYRYERGVTRHEADGTTSHRRIDLYKRGCFVLEAKQGSNPPPETLFRLDTVNERRAAVRRSPSWRSPCSRPRAKPSATPATSPPRKAGRPSSSSATWASASTSTPTSAARGSTTRSSRTA